MVALKPTCCSCGVSSNRGSRNAVVALKLPKAKPIPRNRSTKQERRGGIETDFIELFNEPSTLEAGTPWWH